MFVRSFLFVMPAVAACFLAACQSDRPVAKVPPKPAAAKPKSEVAVKKEGVSPRPAVKVSPAAPMKIAPKGPVAKAGGGGSAPGADWVGRSSAPGAAGGKEQSKEKGDGKESTAAVNPVPTQPKAALAVVPPAVPVKVAPPIPSREALRQREVDAAKEAAKKVLAAVPQEVTIAEKVTVKLPDNAQIRETWDALQGEWEQSEGAHAADCVEGGYTERKLIFGKDGILIIRQRHGPGRTLTRTMDFTIEPEGKIQLGKERKPDEFLLAKTRQIVHGTDGEHEILPPAAAFPVTLPVEVSADKTGITLDGKVYRKVK